MDNKSQYCKIAVVMNLMMNLKQMVQAHSQIKIKTNKKVVKKMNNLKEIMIKIIFFKTLNDVKQISFFV